MRVNAPVTFGACQVAPLVTRFLAAYPDVEVELTLTDRFVDVVDEGYDAVFRLGPIKDMALAARRLADHTLVACAAPSYLAAWGTPITPEDLATHQCLGFVNWSGLAYAEWRFTKAGHLHAVRVHSRFQVNDGRALRAAALGGHGIILQPKVMTRDDIAAGRVVQVLPDYAAPSRQLYLLFSSRPVQTPKLRAFIDCVVEAFPRPAD